MRRLKNLECLFINLDSAGQRRADLEANFAACKGAGWTLTRFPAIDAENGQRVPGGLRSAEKACFLSHRLAIASKLASPHPIFLLEDDALLGPHTAELVDKVIFANDNLGWDLLFTDICVPHIASMLQLVRLRQQLAVPDEVRLINLRTFAFAGATAYIINARSIAKVHRLLEPMRILEEPFDIVLRNLVAQGRLTAFALFPFATTLSGASDTSQIQDANGAGTDLVWNLFRKMIWVDRDIHGHKFELEQLDRMLCDDETRPFGTLFGAMASKKFTDK